jgi:predicted DCC family thiol-disulfide oxidoreductase YuxK
MTNRAETERDGERSTPPSVRSVSERHPVLLFDGVCNLCNRWIQFVIERDPDAVFRFAPLQSPAAQRALDKCGYDGDSLDSVVLVDDGECYAKSDAVIRTARHLGGVYRLLGPTGIVPRRLRNWLYDFVADHRYGWFGKRDQCMMPSPDVEDRFLAGGPGAESTGE